MTKITAEQSAVKRRYYEANRERILAERRVHYQANRLSVRGRQKRYYDARSEDLQAYSRRYRNLNLESVRAHDTERCYPGWNLMRRHDQHELQGRACAVCRGAAPFEDLEIDHDHGCCDTGPQMTRSCGQCVRGLVHRSCNQRVHLQEIGRQRYRDVTRYLAHHQPEENHAPH